MVDVAHGRFQVAPCGAPCRPHWRSDRLAYSVPLPCSPSCRKCAASSAESPVLDAVMRPAPQHDATVPRTQLFQQYRWQASQARLNDRPAMMARASGAGSAMGASGLGQIRPFDQRVHYPPTRRHCCRCHLQGRNGPWESCSRAASRVCSPLNRL